MKHALVDKREPHLESDELLSLTLYLDVAEVQEGQANGIVAQVSVDNESEHPISLLNPYEMLQFLLVNEAGFPVLLPKKAPSLLTPRRTPGWKLDSPLPILGFSQNDQGMDVGELDSEVLVFDAHVINTVRFAIDRFLDEGKEIPLADGTYRIQCLATVINAENREESRIVESPQITVHFVKGS